MDKVIHCLGMIFLLTFVSSCIKDNSVDCISQYTIRIFVKDKNYFNVDAVSPQDRVDEGLPFRRFSGTIYYTLSRASSGELLQESSVTSVTGDGAYFSISLKDIPYGDYKLTVWGNRTEDLSVGYLHKDNAEKTDLYLATTLLKVEEAFQTSDLALERNKGLLTVRFTNFPDYIKTIGATVSNVYESVSSDFVYAGNTSVNKVSPFQQEMRVLLAPSVRENDSQLQLNLYTSSTMPGSPPSVTLPKIALDLNRNEISLILVDYNLAVEAWEIWAYIDDQWTKIHSLHIEEIPY